MWIIKPWRNSTADAFWKWPHCCSNETTRRSCAFIICFQCRPRKRSKQKRNSWQINIFCSYYSHENKSVPLFCQAAIGGKLCNELHLEASNVHTNDDKRKRSRIIDSHPVSVAPVVPSLGLVLDFARPDQPNKFPLHDNYEVFSKANQEIANVTILFIYVPSKICNQDSEIFEHHEELVVALYK